MNSANQQITDLFMTHGGVTDALPSEVRALAHAMGQIHGDILISSESSGYHLNMASPVLLAQDGRVELSKRHLAVNASRYFGFGDFEKLKPRSRDKCGLCMKSRRPYRVSELLDMLPLSLRGFPEFGDGKITDKVVTRHEIDDGNGNLIPDHPGIVTPLLQLPPDHPALAYLAAREGVPVNIGLMDPMYSAT